VFFLAGVLATVKAMVMVSLRDMEVCHMAQEKVRGLAPMAVKALDMVLDTVLGMVLVKMKLVMVKVQDMVKVMVQGLLLASLVLLMVLGMVMVKVQVMVLDMELVTVTVKLPPWDPDPMDR